MSFSVDIRHYSTQLQAINDTVVRVKTKITTSLNRQIESVESELARNHISQARNSTAMSFKLKTLRALKTGASERFRIHEHNSQQFASSISQKLELIESAFLIKERQPRSRRSLLPWAGDLLKSLFGTATKSDLSTRLREDLMRLGSSHNKLIHEVENSLTIINKSHEHVVENRDSINNLTTVVNVISSRLQALRNSFTSLYDFENTVQ